jgi:hypothetical protein
MKWMPAERMAYAWAAAALVSARKYESYPQEPPEKRLHRQDCLPHSVLGWLLGVIDY